MHTEIYRQLLYWLSTPILAMLVGTFIRRRLVRQFPFFFAYLVVACVGEIAGFWAYHRDALSYFYTYWISGLVSAIFIFLATYELFVRRLFPGFYKTTSYRYLFSAVALVATILGIYAVLGGAKLAIVANVINTLNSLRMAGLFFLVALMLLMGRHWSKYEFGLALGLGVDAVAFVITFALFLKSGPLHGILRELPPLAGDVVSIIWLITFLRPAKPSTVPKAPTSTEVIQEAKQWEAALKESLSAKKRNNSDESE